MTDIFSKKKRSEIMSRIKSKNTGPEIIAFRWLRKRGIYFQRHYDRVIGKPDIAWPRRKIALFIDGDFWHGRKFVQQKERLPQIYWRDKIEKNILRDRMNRRALKKNGWRIVQIWASDLMKSPNKILMNKIGKLFSL